MSRAHYQAKRAPEEAARPALFVAVGCTATILAGGLSSVLLSPYVKPARPYAAVEFWQGGRQLGRDAALRLLPPGLRACALGLEVGAGRRA
jgi:hypothetical protein